MTQAAPDPHGRAASLETLDDLRAVQAVPTPVLRESAWFVSRPPPPTTWRTILDPLALILGIALVAAGVLYLVAFNWTEIGRGSKVALGVLALGVTGVVPWFLPGDSLARKLLLAAGIPMTLGALLAVGLAYPTMAPGWPLLLMWAALALPWTLASRLSPAWLLQAVAADVAVGAALSAQAYGGIEGVLDQADPVLLGILGVHLVAWAGFAVAAAAKVPGATEWVRQTLLAPVLLILAWWPIEAIALSGSFSGHEVNAVDVIGILAFLAVAVLIQVGFFLRRFGPFPAAIQTLTVIAVSTTIAGRLAIELIDSMEGLALFLTLPMGLFVLLELALAAAWLVWGWRRQTDESTP